MTIAITISSVFPDAVKKTNACTFLIVIRNVQLIQIASPHLAVAVMVHALKKLSVKVIK